MAKKTNDKWKVNFGRVKSMDIDANAIFTAVRKKNPYIRGARYQALPKAQTIGTNSELY